MSYVNNADVEQRLGTALYVQLTDDSGTGLADEGRVGEAVSAAEGLVNSYLGRRYAVPIDTTRHAELAPLLRSVTLDLVEYRLHARRPPVPGDVDRKYQASVRWLERLADGQSLLPSLEEVRSNPATGIVGQAIGPPRVLSREQMQDV